MSARCESPALFHGSDERDYSDESDTQSPCPSSPEVPLQTLRRSTETRNMNQSEITPSFEPNGVIRRHLQFAGVAGKSRIALDDVTNRKHRSELSSEHHSSASVVNQQILQEIQKTNHQLEHFAERLEAVESRLLAFEQNQVLSLVNTTETPSGSSAEKPKRTVPKRVRVSTPHSTRSLILYCMYTVNYVYVYMYRA